ncbi:MAG TPA: methyltransferase domain-containing protein [Caldilineaceae bacterium]|nr:methyltransferase domain-containing protein [Caldilineaceae bacterium]
MIRALTNTVSLGAGTFIGNQVTVRVACLTQPRPMPHQLASLLDHSLRLKYRTPAEDVGLYGCGAGMSVLDLGCGTGLYTVELARRVGDNGVVHAVDLQQSLVEQTRQRIAAADLSGRVRFYCEGAYQLPIADKSIDLAVMVATLAEIPNKPLALTELSRVLKAGGRLVVSEEMPDPAYVPPWVTRRWLEEAGFRFGGQNGNWFCYHQIVFNP